MIDMEISDGCIFDHVKISDGEFGEISVAKLCHPIEKYCSINRSASDVFLPKFGTCEIGTVKPSLKSLVFISMIIPKRLT